MLKKGTEDGATLHKKPQPTKSSAASKLTYERREPICLGELPEASRAPASACPALALGGELSSDLSECDSELLRLRTAETAKVEELPEPFYAEIKGDERSEEHLSPGSRANA